MCPFALNKTKKQDTLGKKLWSLEVVNIRDYAKDIHKTVDDTPFGGGSGMLMRADVLADSLDKNILDKTEPIVYLSPKGKKFDQHYAKKLLSKNINIICGHFEGVDQRILETRNIDEISIGDYVLSGGEVGAFVRSVLNSDSKAKTCIVAVPADRSPLLRIRGADRATAIAEYFKKTNFSS